MLSNCTMSLPVSHISQKRARSVEVDPLLLLSTLSMIEQKILSSSSDPRHELEEEDDGDIISTLVEPTKSARGFRARSPSKSYRDWLLQGTPEAFLAGYEKKKRIDILATNKKNISRRCNANETNVVTPPATPTESSSDKLLFQKTLETTGAKRQNNESDDIDTFSSSASSADDHEYQWCYIDCIIPLKD